MNKVQEFEKTIAVKDIPVFDIGDTVIVSVRILEEGKSRLQDFEGIVIRKKGSGLRTVFTVRRISYGEGVERTFPLHSPNVSKVTIVKKGKTRRAKLYYLRKKIGKRGKVDEKIEKEKAGKPAAPPAREEAS